MLTVVKRNILPTASPIDTTLHKSVEKRWKTNTAALGSHVETVNTSRNVLHILDLFYEAQKYREDHIGLLYRETRAEEIVVISFSMKHRQKRLYCCSPQYKATGECQAGMNSRRQSAACAKKDDEIFLSQRDSDSRVEVWRKKTRSPSVASS